MSSPDRLSFFDSGKRSGEWNMTFDAACAHAMDKGAASPLLRVFGWSPWCISLGKHQSLDDIDADRARRDGIDVVYRPTGGRAILHAEELTYSVVMPSRGKSIMDVYRLISEALADGLRELVPSVGMARTAPNLRKLYQEAGGIPCFASSARYEIEYDGRKLVGSAQRRIGNTVLQHGSILIGDAHLRLTDYLAVDAQTQTDIRSDMTAHTITLNEILARSVAYEEVAAAVRRGFERAWNTRIEETGERDLLSATTETIAA